MLVYTTFLYNSEKRTWVFFHELKYIISQSHVRILFYKQFHFFFIWMPQFLIYEVLKNYLIFAKSDTKWNVTKKKLLKCLAKIDIEQHFSGMAFLSNVFFFKFWIYLVGIVVKSTVGKLF